MKGEYRHSNAVSKPTTFKQRVLIVLWILGAIVMIFIGPITWLFMGFGFSEYVDLIYKINELKQ